MSLDDDLATWAATVRLTDAEAEAGYQRIVFPPAAVPPTAAAPPAAATARRPRAVTAFPAAAARVTTLPEYEGLTPSWWRDYTRGFAAGMVTATRPVLVAA